MVYVPGTLISTLLEGVTVTLESQLSVAVAPGSVNEVWHSTVIELGPVRLITGLIASLTVTVRVHVAVLPALSVAVITTVVTPEGNLVPGATDWEIATSVQLSVASTSAVRSGMVAQLESAVMALFVAQVTITGAVPSGAMITFWFCVDVLPCESSYVQ
jgi:hypothetical protein